MDTPLGDIYVKWEKCEARTYLFVTVPFGAEAELTLPDGKRTLFHGSYCFEV